jgi:ATP-binding cassette, subfamily B, multidrug efflux pump
VTQPSATAQRFYAHLARLIRPYRRDFSVGLLATAAASGLAVLIPLAFRGGVDSVVQHGRSAPLLLYGLAVILLTVAKGWGDYLAYQRIAGMGQRIAYDLRNRIFTHLQSLPPAFFDQANTGDIMSRATSDVDGVRMFINWSLSSFLEMVFLFIAAFVLMSVMSWQLTLLVSAMFPLLGYAVMRFRRRLRPRYLAVQEQYGRMTTALQENLAGIRLIQAYCQEQSETARFREINLELFRRAMAAAWERAVYLPMMFCLGSATGGMVLWFGGSQVMSGRLTLGELVAFIGYVGLLARPLSTLGWMISLAQRAVASLGRIEEILSTAPAPAATAQTDAVVPAPTGSTGEQPLIVFEGVDFAYNGRPTLRGINFRGWKGELVAITGPSGAGKSTIGHLISRLYEVSAGRVMLDGIDVRDVALQELRRRVAVVPQEAFLFSASVAENLAYGRPDALPEAIHGVAYDTCLWESVQTFPHGIATMVGERGITLSGGQKQRVALGRALLYGGEVLVLDDPFSNVDAETEERLLETIRAAARERLALLITHRIRTLQAADRIIVVADGRIVAEGPHRQLLAQGGLYRQLYEHQCLRDSLA